MRYDEYDRQAERLRSAEDRRVTLAHKAARLTKYAVRPLDAVLATRHSHHGLKVA